MGECEDNASDIARVQVVDWVHQTKTYTYVLNNQGNLKYWKKADKDFRQWLEQRVKTTGGVSVEIDYNANENDGELLKDFLMSLGNGQRKDWLIRNSYNTFSRTGSLLTRVREGNFRRYLAAKIGRWNMFDFPDDGILEVNGNG
jgi:hypothetical protein